MILAIVGTRHFANPKALKYAEILITHEVAGGGWTSFVTGDAPGIDTMVKRICDELGRPCQVLAPFNRTWEPEGYKARNIMICQTAHEMLCLRDPESTTYGSGWTADHMETLGKPVTRITIS